MIRLNDKCATRYDNGLFKRKEVLKIEDVVEDFLNIRYIYIKIFILLINY
jgi:hypothetical protein